MHDSHTAVNPRHRSSHEGVWRLQQVVPLTNSSSLPQVMHVEPHSQIARSAQSAGQASLYHRATSAGTPILRRTLPPRHPPSPSHLDDVSILPGTAETASRPEF